MATKSLSIPLDHVYESPRGGSMSVAKALAYLATEDEEGEAIPLHITAGDAIVYAAFRKMALAKDSRRHGNGEAPDRIYTPRVDVKDAPETAAKVKAAAAARFAEMLGVEISKPEPAKAKAAPKAKDERAAKIAANAARIAELEAKLSAKAAPAKAPTVRKATQPASKPAKAAHKPDSSPAMDAARVLDLATAAEARGDKVAAEKLFNIALSMT